MNNKITYNLKTITTTTCHLCKGSTPISRDCECMHCQVPLCNDCLTKYRCSTCGYSVCSDCIDEKTMTCYTCLSDY